MESKIKITVVGRAGIPLIAAVASRQEFPTCHRVHCREALLCQTYLDFPPIPLVTLYDNDKCLVYKSRENFEQQLIFKLGV